MKTPSFSIGRNVATLGNSGFLQHLTPGATDRLLHTISGWSIPPADTLHRQAAVIVQEMQRFFHMASMTAEAGDEVANELSEAIAHYPAQAREFSALMIDGRAWIGTAEDILSGWEGAIK